MPWTGPQFAQHNHHLSPEQATHASHIANAILRRSGDDGMAIATANKLVHRDGGGMVPASTVAPTSGLQPSNSTQNPMSQNIIQRFASMTPEQLQEVIPRLGSSPMAQIAQRVLQQKHVMPQQGQQSQSGAGLPQYGVQPQQAASSAPPSQSVGQVAPGGGTGYATGGGMRPASDKDVVPILAAGGEFVIHPDYVARLGGGDIKKGHEALDKWVVEKRAEIVKKTKSLKGPVKS